MKRIAAIAATLAISGFVQAATTQVDGYIRRDGTYVAPHYRTTPDGRLDNNWSSQGNQNPYTGERGSVNPYQPVQPQPRQPRYSLP